MNDLVVHDVDDAANDVPDDVRANGRVAAADLAAVSPRFLATIVETQNDVLAIELDPTAVMEVIAERTQLLTGATGATVEVREGDRMVYRVACGTLAAHRGAAVPVMHSLSGLSAMTGAVLVCDDAEADARVDAPACRRLGIRSMVVVPLAQSGEPGRRGWTVVLKVCSSEPRAFDAGAVSGLRIMAGLLGNALAHATEFEAKRRLLAERTAALAAAREANDRLRESRERFQSAFDYAAIGMALVALDGRWLQVNDSICRIVGYTAAELLATDFQSVTHPDDLDADLANVRDLVTGRIDGYQMTKRYVHKRGHLVWVLLSVSLVRGADGQPLYFISQIQDVTERKRAEWLERDRRQVLEMVARDLPLPDVLSRLAEMVERQVPGAIAVVMAVQDGELLFQGPSLPSDWRDGMRRGGLSLAAALARSVRWEDVAAAPSQVTDLHADGAWAALRPLAARDGIATCWTVGVAASDGAPLGLLAVLCRERRAPTAAEAQTLDMAAKLATICVEHHNTTRQLAHLVRHDPLTGLPNRLCFEDRLQQATAIARRSGQKVAVLCLDVDRFKQVNDTFGHEAGDALLQQFARRLTEHLRRSDTLARVGGDEFMLVLPNLPGPEAAATVAAKLVQSLEAPFPVAGRELIVTSSMGVALYPDDGDDSPTLQRVADARMYQTKRRGRNGFTMGEEKGEGRS